MALALTRQKLPTLPGTDRLARDGVARGGYILREAAGGTPELIMIATGSELQLAFAAAETLEAEGIPTRVVSLPCWERFEAQDEAYRESRPAARCPQAGQRRDRRLARLGALGRRRRARSSASTISAHRRLPPRSSSTSGSPPSASTDIGRRVVRDGLHGRIATVDGGHFGHMDPAHH